MTKQLRIFLVGEVSAGKSSLLNAISGGIISNASTQRETMTPEIYSFVDRKNMKAFASFKKIASMLELKHIDNKNKIIDLKKYTELEKSKLITDLESKTIHFKSMFGIGNYLCYDFPGLNDSNDTNNIFFKSIEQNISECDCLLYITSAESGFVKQSEVDLFMRLKKLCEDTKNNNGQYIKLAIVINKY